MVAAKAGELGRSAEILSPLCSTMFSRFKLWPRLGGTFGYGNCGAGGSARGLPRNSGVFVAAGSALVTMFPRQ